MDFHTGSLQGQRDASVEPALRLDTDRASGPRHWPSYKGVHFHSGPGLAKDSKNNKKI